HVLQVLVACLAAKVIEESGRCLRPQDTKLTEKDRATYPLSGGVGKIAHEPRLPAALRSSQMQVTGAFTFDKSLAGCSHFVKQVVWAQELVEIVVEQPFLFGTPGRFGVEGIVLGQRMGKLD